MKEKIKEFWNERAKQHGNMLTATTNDIYMRKLEVSTIVGALQELPIPEHGAILDVGCGDGYSTLEVAQAMPNLRMLGMDYSENMIETACERLDSQPDLRDRVEFIVGDVMDMRQACGNSKYDVILSVRCLINLGSTENQIHAISEIAEHTKPDGHYISLENFVETHENMNMARRTVELPEIPVKWYNLFFREHEFVRTGKRFFKDIVFRDFASSYYFATRVIYSSMCQMRGDEPDYKHEIHQLAVSLPWVGQFSPTRMAILSGKLKRLEHKEKPIMYLSCLPPGSL